MAENVSPRALDGRSGSRSVRVAVAIAALTILAAAVVSRLASRTPPVWDDAYMFVRYAGNLLAEGRMVWNPGGEPTWGATSLAFVVVVAASKVLGIADPLRALVASSLACGTALLVLLARLARTAGRGTIVFVLAALAVQARPLAAHLVSGMDTIFGAAWLAGYLVLAYRMRGQETSARATALGCVGGLALFARPELLLFSIGVPLGMALFGSDPGGRRSARLAAAVTAAVILAGVLAAWGVFGLPLPLPFYVKTLGVYGEAMRAAYEGTALRQAATFAAYNTPSVIAAIAGAVAWRRGKERPDLGIEVGLVAALVAFGLFETFAVTPIMFYEQRFFYPALPAVLALGCRGLVLARAESRTLLAACALLLVVPSAGLAREAMTGAPVDPRRWSLRASRLAFADDWFALDRLTELPDDLVIATTEVGHPGALLPGKTIVDLAGLNDAGLVRSGMRPAAVFLRRPPDWIYLPHGDYREFREAIEADPYFVAHYDVFRVGSLGSARVETGGSVVRKPYWLDVAIRRDGPHAATLRALLEEERGR